VAVANLRGAHAGLAALGKIPQRDRLESNYLLHAVTGELQLRSDDHAAAVVSFRRGLELSQVGPEREHLQRMLQQASATP
ncbi:MAG: sigma factor, ECF subfamily protein, partial [Verrucomicrobiota bacterium]|nr:sigma factor, ECF subfamily protein [Verrucomicrobiota bacterium]